MQQSFDEPTLRMLARELASIPRVFLTEPAIAEQWLSPRRMKEAAAFVNGIGPASGECDGQISQRARRNALFPLDLGVDAVFTDNPNRFPTN